MTAIEPFRAGISPSGLQGGLGIEYLNEAQVNALTARFQEYYDQAPGPHAARIRGRYFLVFLFLRYTGGRVSEVVGIDDQVDVDYRAGDVTMEVLKRHNPKKKGMKKMVAVPLQVVNELARYLAQYPDMRGKALRIGRSNFYLKFRELATACGVPLDLAHPHVLRHTRTLELVRAGVPLTIVQQMLGHSVLNTTAIYLQFSGQEAKAILKDKGLI